MWPFGMQAGREEVQHRSNDVDLSEQAGREDVGLSALFDQPQRQFLVAHMAGGAEAGLEIASFPVMGGVEQGGVSCQQFFDLVHVSMSGPDEFLDQGLVQGRFILLESGNGYFGSSQSDPAGTKQAKELIAFEVVHNSTGCDVEKNGKEASSLRAYGPPP